MTFTLIEMEKLLAKKLSEKAEIDFPCWFFKDIPRILCEGIADALLRGEKVRLERVGCLETVVKKPRCGRNPKSGEVIRIPAHTGIKFKKSEELLRRLNNLPKPPPRKPKTPENI
jgi:nucleoid DNA-binding protein